LQVFQLEEKLALVRRRGPFEQRSADSNAVEESSSLLNVG
jgi:hypothetical protein